MATILWDVASEKRCFARGTMTAAVLGAWEQSERKNSHWIDSKAKLFSPLSMRQKRSIYVAFHVHFWFAFWLLVLCSNMPLMVSLWTSFSVRFSHTLIGSQSSERDAGKFVNRLACSNNDLPCLKLVKFIVKSAIGIRLAARSDPRFGSLHCCTGLGCDHCDRGWAPSESIFDFMSSIE